MVKILQTPEWQALAAHADQLATQRMVDWFAKHPTRFNEFSVRLPGLFMDYSKNFCTRETWPLLFQLLKAVDFERERERFFAGESVNTTENRPAWHMALRAKNKPAEVVTVLDKMTDIVNRLRTGAWLGFTGAPITDVISIGIGGSDLGPLMVCRALKGVAPEPVRCHFISNIDQQPLKQLLNTVDPTRTLIIAISKSFTTQETLLNATHCREWLLAAGCSNPELRQHFLAVTAKPEMARAFGLEQDCILPLWDWVGGRYSLWSAVGLTVAIQIGMNGFLELLAGAERMDQHFLTAPLPRNMPVILGLLANLYLNFFDATSQVIIPYIQSLEYLPSYLQQSHMESLGKRVSKRGEILEYETGQIIWGSTGTNSQHAYHQLLMQGTQLIPSDFIVAKNPKQPALFAHCLAQAQVLMTGVHSENPHKVIPGNQPNTLIVLDELTPNNLGALIALYEHKIFVQAAIWQINPFDQWGVERGKVMAQDVEQQLSGLASENTYDGSTQGLMQYYLTEEVAHV